MQTHQDTATRTHAAWPAAEPKDDLLNTTEAAKELRVHPLTLKNWRSTGAYDLPFTKIGAKVFYRRSVIDDVKLNGLRKSEEAAQ
jgi:hypothetical protein